VCSLVSDLPPFSPLFLAMLWSTTLHKIYVNPGHCVQRLASFPSHPLIYVPFVVVTLMLTKFRLQRQRPRCAAHPMPRAPDPQRTAALRLSPQRGLTINKRRS
jgi:hypothetical protein